ncbi:MAG TPA: hypothetical protein VJ372_10580 [Pyrinomonadaceae bacterium]|nr:hypothetical protein [Pyrinomonadaceae bacterium]
MNNRNTEKRVGVAGLNRKVVFHSLGLIFVALLWPITNANASVYSLSLFGPMYATNSDGDTIRLNAAGTFDTVNGGVEVHGSYSIRNAAGEVTGRGTWAATEFVSFESDGGLNKGLQGGELSLIVTLSPNDGPPDVGVPFTLTCPFENGVFDIPSCDMTVGDFVTPAGGIMGFHLITP